MKALAILLVVFSLTSCATIKRPNVDICVVNAPGKKLTCYNFERDYAPDGQIKPGVNPHFRPAPDVAALNKHLIFTSDEGPENAIAKLKAYIKNLREVYEKGCK
jgi:hypothetical protein